MNETPLMARRPTPEPPIVTPDNAGFWQAAARGVLAIKTCDDCTRPYWYPRLLCPRCMGARTRWVEATGKGEIYSFSRMLQGPNAPHAIAYVTLDEGVTLLTNIIDCDLATLQVGQRVQVVFVEAAAGGAIPYFTPVSATVEAA